MCFQATCQYLNRSWPNAMTPYDVTRHQYVNCPLRAWLCLSIIRPNWHSRYMKCVALYKGPWCYIHPAGNSWCEKTSCNTRTMAALSAEHMTLKYDSYCRRNRTFTYWRHMYGKEKIYIFIIIFFHCGLENRTQSICFTSVQKSPILTPWWTKS